MHTRPALYHVGLLARLVQTSRPGFAIITLWLLFAPLGCVLKQWRADPSHLPVSLAMLAYTFPMQLGVYAWNDLGDARLDRSNPRKRGLLKWIIGPGGTVPEAELRGMVVFAVVLNCGFMAYFATLVEAHVVPWLGAWFATAITLNWLYNGSPRWRAGPAPLDFVGPLGYLLILPLSSWVHRRPQVPASVFWFSLFMIFRSQLWGQIFDIGTDSRAGRRTTAVLLGVRGSRALLAILVACEAACAYETGDRYVFGFSLISFFAACVELFVFPPVPPRVLHALVSGAIMTPAALAVLYMNLTATGALSGDRCA